MTFVKRSELNAMAKIVVDEETGMTQLDYWEWAHSFDDIFIDEDEPDFYDDDVDTDDDDYYEDDVDECGFNPYMGCYDYDC